MFANVLIRKSSRICIRNREYCSFRNQPNKSEEATSVRKSYGQPTDVTHPFLIRKGEVTPGIEKSEFRERRQRLIEAFQKYTVDAKKKADGHIVVIPSATKQYMSDKIPYVFRQNTDFLYLSGCLEPDSCLVLTTSGNSPEHTSTLFLRKKDSQSEIWDGPRTGPDEAPNLFGVDRGLPVQELDAFLSCLTVKSKAKNSLVWYDLVDCVQPAVHKTMLNCYKGMSNKIWEPPRGFLHQLRVVKSRAEIKLMKRSCEIAARSIRDTIADSKPGISEHTLYANVDHKCRLNGAEYLAYPPVVAGGPRATIIHYINNNQIVKENDMVLMDAGCEYHGYTSDITRTWPISGAFTNPQRILYEVVLQIQYELIDMLNQFPSLDKLFDVMCISLGKKLREIGLVSSNKSEYELARLAFQFCPHHVSHYLGMDVHDTPKIPRSVKVVPGMVVTVEPGIYISEDAKVPEEFRGIGIRIEDDILITENGPQVLTKDCPKTIEEITRLNFAALSR